MAQEHWNRAHSNKPVSQTGWFEETPTLSLMLIDRCGLALDDPILDAGGGTSSLAGHLLDRGFTEVSVLDISGAAIEELRKRLGTDRADHLQFICADITDPAALEDIPPLALWHDRAMLHFLTSPDDCDRYATALNRAVRRGGYALLATYSLEGAPT